MSFDYGSADLSISNPFKLEGALYAVRGAVNTGLGVILLLSARAQVAGEPTPTEIALLVAGILFLSVGLSSLVKGLFKLFRFYVGRNVPANLPRNDQGVDVAKMMRERVNQHFLEPVGLIGRGIHSLFPALLYIPLPLRIIAVRAAHNLFITVFVLALVGLALLSGSIGVIAMPAAATEWLYLLGSASIFLAALANFPYKSTLSDKQLQDGHVGIGGYLILLTILAPVVLSIAQQKSNFAFTSPPVSGGGWLMFFAVASIVASVITLAICILRAREAKPLTEVAERIEHLEAGVHPSDLMRSVEIQLTKHRYLEIPNREYMKMRPDLTWEEGTKRGKFEGMYLVEVQPKPTTPEHATIFKQAQNVSGLAGHALMLVAGIWLFSFLLNNPFENGPAWYEALVLPVSMAMYAKFLAQAAHAFWAEINFVSSLAFLRLEGTFTEAKVATGKSIHDSTLSENTVIQSRLSYYLWVCDAVTSTFAVSGRYNLEQSRWLLAMNKNDALCNELDQEMRRFGAEAQKLASVTSSEDLTNIGNLTSMNHASRQVPGKEQPVAISDEEAAGALAAEVDQ
ncbi:hypothetical protein ACFO5Q_03905 [Kordiimonas lipolytica]|uniref:Uncharacterized protein n=1 Tax=Kordiimonas lipolytica TaxID=1662421 RepID=A0ABV8U883_9PROT|nr:hypothetical protein [Kordiimonas lipolytica]